MYKTKAKSKIKNTMWKKLTIGGGEKLAQKLLSVGVSVSLMLAMVPLGSQNFIAEADEPKIPATMFITKDDLLDLCATTNNGEGLLATGTASDKELFINLGMRPSEVRYFKELVEDVDEGHVTVPCGVMTWRVTGSETVGANPGLVLLSKEPILSAPALDPDLNCLFQTSSDHISTRTLHDYGTYPDGFYIYDVSPNHWGASRPRAKLNHIVFSFFTKIEQALLEISKLTTMDLRNSVSYETNDPFYFLAAKLDADTILAGEANNLSIHKNYWSGESFLRSPFSVYDSVLSTWPSDSVQYDCVADPLSFSAGDVACRINLESVIFASAASVVSTNDGVTPIPDSTPQRLRLSGDSRLSSAQISVDYNNFIYSAPAGSRLVVLATTFDGKTLQYSTNISQDVVNAALTAQELQDITGFGGIIANAVAWIEMDDPDSNKSQLLYATDPVTFPRGFFDFEAVSPITLETVVNVNGIDQKILVRSTNAVIPDGTKLTAQADSSGEGLDHQNYIIEKKFHYEITLVDANGTPLPMPLSEPVELCFEVIEGWDKNDLEVVLRKIGDDISFEKELKDIDGKQYVCVKTNHFSPYSLLDKLNDEERNQVIFFAILGLSLIIGLSLGIILKLRKNKKRSE